jgi:DNA-binding response OmpR family regulator
MGIHPLALDADIAVRLADEGVPLRAIARATKIASEDLRSALRTAKDTGRLLELPREDWPVGFPRDQRALQLSRMVTENREAFTFAVKDLFGLTRTQIALLLALIQHPSVPKDRVSTRPSNVVEVHVSHLRKRLAPFGINVATCWGYGYQLPADDRRKAMDLILARVAA